MNETIEKIKHYIVDAMHNPSKGYWIAMGLLALYLLAIILDWKHAISYNLTSNGWRNFLLENYSRKTVRIVYGTIVVAAMILVNVVFYYFKNK